jgi:hypothetical protein
MDGCCRSGVKIQAAGQRKRKKKSLLQIEAAEPFKFCRQRLGMAGCLGMALAGRSVEEAEKVRSRAWAWLAGCLA